MRKMKKVLSLVLSLVLVCGIVAGFAACSGNKENNKKEDTTAQSDLAKIQAAGVLKVGITEYEPMNYKDKNGEWTGFDTEFAQALGEKLGVKVQFVEINWNNKYNELSSGAVDCLWNGMTITDEGKKAASITNAYAENAQVVVMKQSEVGKYKTTDDLKNLKSIAIEGGSAGEKAAQAAGLTNTVVSDSQALALTEVTSGSADACIIDLTMANAMTGEGTANKNLTYSIKLEAEEYGIAFRKGSDMAAKTNELMAGMMKDGTLDKLAKKYQIVLIKDADNKLVTTYTRGNIMFWQVTQQLLEGFESTLKLFCITLVAALPLGLIISFGSMSKFRPLKWLCKTLIWIIRGTPLVLQMIIVYYGPGLVGNWAQNLENPNAFITWLAGWTVFDRFVAVSVAFIINYACYFSEIFRGGIEAIPKGQYEAGQVLGMTRNQIFRKVVFMQVVKRIIPPMSNEIITLVKDTSLARVISVYEIIWAGEKFMKLDGLLWPLFYTGVFYLIFCGILTVLFNRLEKKLDYYKG